MKHTHRKCTHFQSLRSGRNNHKKSIPQKHTGNRRVSAANDDDVQQRRIGTVATVMHDEAAQNTEARPEQRSSSSKQGGKTALEEEELQGVVNKRNATPTNDRKQNPSNNSNS